MAYVVHLCLVMQLLFLVLSVEQAKISSTLIIRVIEVYRDSDVKVIVHVSIEKYVAESAGFGMMGRDQAFDVVVDRLLERYCESTEISDLKNEILSALGLSGRG